ncbi:MAG: hypothetical protein WC047_00095 [Kiritimatiellales bacterium]
MHDINTMIDDMVQSGKTVQGIADAVRAESMTTMELEAVHAERRRQDAKWGANSMDGKPLYEWCAIAGEEYGEWCQAINEPLDSPRGGYENMRNEAIQVAAVMVRFLECLDRQVIKENHK